MRKVQRTASRVVQLHADRRVSQGCGYRKRVSLNVDRKREVRRRAIAIVPKMETAVIDGS